MHNNKEEEMLKFWEKDRIYEKLKKKNEKGKKFYMMDGPPYATGHIHMGTALNKILKDVAMRLKRMQGYNVFDRAGYDTHGVPIEFQIEKEIGTKNKKDIEKYGIKKFIEKCKEFATRYIDVMNSEFKNLGVWMNFGNPYLTLSSSYIEKIWDTFKIADQKKLLYLGKYPVHVCPRCETAVAYNEIEYARQEDVSIYVKFPLKRKNNAYLIIWTTTPWTLPGNTGVMVGDYAYQEIEISNGERWILAKELIPKIMAALELGYTVKQEFNGRKMEGWEYENPLAKNLKLKVKNAYKVVFSARYVNLEDGTGLVHCAPGHGKEDFEVGKEYGLDMPSPVDINGMMSKEAGKYSGKKARVVDEEIIKDLENEGMLVYKHKYTHDYPLCWRCKSALLMISQPQWFLKISQIHSKLLRENEKTNWIPDWMKQRMKSWLEGIADWPVSRKRYWGTPLPIWLCDKCGEKIVIGSITELEKLSGKKIKEVHKPEIDEILIKCKCNGMMKRVEDVLDVWFDSGVSSWAVFDNAEFKKYWPADLNIEGKDQIRGWWNSQFILSMIKFEKKPFENIMVHGMILDLGRKKMSKSLGNIITPKEIIEKYGRDYLRYYFAKTSKGEDFAFNEEEFLDVLRVFRILLNVNAYINQLERKTNRDEIEDRWIASRFNSMLKEATIEYNKFRFPQAISLIEKFMVEDLSRFYIQLTRERSDETAELLNKMRKDLLIIFSPIIPFTTESIWQELKKQFGLKEESIHLCEWPSVEDKKISKDLEKEMGTVKEVIEKGLASRAEVKIGVRQPLAKLKINAGKDKLKIVKKYEGLIKRQLNIKKIEWVEGEEKLELDTKITAELEAEGFLRELARKIQEARKKAGLKKEQNISLFLKVDGETEKIIKKDSDFLKSRVNASQLLFEKDKKGEKIKHHIKEDIKGRHVDVNFE